MGLNTKREFIEGIDHIPVSQVLHAFLKTAVQLNLPVVFYQGPNSKQVKAVLGHHYIPHYRLTIEDSIPGFVFSPFENFDNTGSFFIPATIEYTSSGNRNSITSTPGDSANSEIVAYLNNYLKNIDHSFATPDFFKGPGQNGETVSYPNYFQSVNSALEAIQQETFKKVVLAQKKDIPLSNPMDPVDLFLRLGHKYKRAFVSMVSLPNVGTWLGSSPETLLKIDQQKLMTVALAGTKTVDLADKHDVWTQKEFEEQEIVVQNIHDSFVAADIKNYVTNGPETIQAGSLIHLKTIFEATIQHPDLYKATRLLEQIHPTSAICGTPNMEAHRFIREHESFPREFYAGYLGTINIDSTLDLYVNIRCARLFHDHISLFSGSGITAESKAELENQEIQLKFRTIEKVIEEIRLHTPEVLTNSWQQTGQ